MALFTVLVPSWAHLGSILRRLGRILGAILGRLGAILGRRAAILGQLGAILRRLGRVWEASRAPLGPSWEPLELDFNINFEK